jgi:hypothetical protein
MAVDGESEEGRSPGPVEMRVREWVAELGVLSTQRKIIAEGLVKLAALIDDEDDLARVSSALRQMLRTMDQLAPAEEGRPAGAGDQADDEPVDVVEQARGLRVVRGGRP